MGTRWRSGLGSMVLGGTCLWSAATVLGQEIATPPIRLITPAAPEPPLETPRRLIPPASRPLDIPAVDTDHRPLVLAATLEPGWESQPLYQRLWFEPGSRLH